MATSGSTVFNIGTTTPGTGILKSAIAVNTNDVNFYLNGSSIGTDAGVTVMPKPTYISFGSNSYTGSGISAGFWLRRFGYYPSRLPNSELQQLTQ
jgi:hypothetical protein